MNLIYKIFFDKLNKNNNLGSKGSIEVYLRDNLKFLLCSSMARNGQIEI